jgi:hypothetical protein
MKALASLVVACAFASSAFAGPAYSSKGGKGVQPTAPLGCDCFAPGGAFGIYGGAILDDDDSLGGGALAEYFFSEYIGIQASYGIFATDSEHHEIDGGLVLRYPLRSLCVAPYVLVGGGVEANSSNEGNFFAGGGIETRLESVNCLGIFTDGAYHWAGGDKPDYTIVRLGVKFPF